MHVPAAAPRSGLTALSMGEGRGANLRLPLSFK